jgi:chromosome segregation and condensation protein ScpB
MAPVSQPEYAPWLKTLVGARNRPARLTQPALKHWPSLRIGSLSRAEIEQTSWSGCDGVVATLLERRSDRAGRTRGGGRAAMTYGTTSLFLEYFGLRDLEPAGG